MATIETSETDKFLDELRESGETNMFGAGPYLREEFGLSRSEARAIVTAWMQNFSERHPRAIR